jgi:hypothetical protein
MVVTVSVHEHCVVDWVSDAGTVRKKKNFLLVISFRRLSSMILVDVFWLMIYPVTLGSGKRPFADGTITAALKVTESISWFEWRHCRELRAGRRHHNQKSINIRAVLGARSPKLGYFFMALLSGGNRPYRPYFSLAVK